MNVNPQDWPADPLEEARAEIARLRAALEGLREVCSGVEGWLKRRINEAEGLNVSVLKGTLDVVRAQLSNALASDSARGEEKR